MSIAVEISDKELPFSFILIKRKDDKIWMDICFKPTDTHQCLFSSSSHPNHCKENISVTLARRICTIVENQQKKIRTQVNENLKKYN